MEEVLKNSNKVILDKSAQGGNGVLPFLPLPTLGSGGKAGALPAGSAPGGTAPGGGSQAQSSDTATSTPQPSGGQQ